MTHSLTIPYDLVVLPLDSNVLDLKVVQLKSVDKAIDQLFAHFNDQVNTKLVEDLCPYFGMPWPSGIALAEFIYERAHLLEGKQVLELGCGLALPSMALAKKNILVQCTDFHPDVPYFLELNKKENNLPGLNFSSIDWRANEANLQKYDVLLASDVLYDKEQPQALLGTVQRLLKPKGTFYLADPGRPYIDLFIKKIKEQKFQLKEYIHKNIFLFEILAP